MTNIVKLSSDYKRERDTKKVKEEKEKEVEEKKKEELYNDYISCTNDLNKSNKQCKEILITFYRKSGTL